MQSKYYIPAGSAAAPFTVDVTPESAGWTECSLQIVRLGEDLAAGQAISRRTGDTEVMILPLAGGGVVECDGETFELSPRASVFAGPGDMRIDQGLEPVHPSYRWEPDAQWAAYSMDLLGRYMKLALVPERFELPEKFSKFTLAAVGQKMFGHVMQLTAQVQPEAYEYYLKCARPG